MKTHRINADLEEKIVCRLYAEEVTLATFSKERCSEALLPCVCGPGLVRYLLAHYDRILRLFITLAPSPMITAFLKSDEPDYSEDWK